jgi:hypothetical protein
VTSSSSQIEAYLDEMGPYEFEQLVAEVWEELGYRTEVTSGSQDRGVDVIAEQDNPVKQKMLIQAKAYSDANRIGSDEVRRYATLYQQEDDADRVVLVTTSGFTTQAKKLAQDLDVAAIDGEDLIGIIHDAGMASNIESTKPTKGTESGDQTRYNERVGDPNNHDMDGPQAGTSEAESQILEHGSESQNQPNNLSGFDRRVVILSLIYLAFISISLLLVLIGWRSNTSIGGLIIAAGLILVGISNVSMGLLIIRSEWGI